MLISVGRLFQTLYDVRISQLGELRAFAVCDRPDMPTLLDVLFLEDVSFIYFCGAYHLWSCFLKMSSLRLEDREYS